MSEQWGVWMLPPGLGGRWLRQPEDPFPVWSGSREEAEAEARQRASDPDLRECLVEARALGPARPTHTCFVCGSSCLPPSTTCDPCGTILGAAAKIATGDGPSSGDVDDAITVLVHFTKPRPKPVSEHSCARRKSTSPDGTEWTVLDFDCEACIVQRMHGATRHPRHLLPEGTWPHHRGDVHPCQGEVMVENSTSKLLVDVLAEIWMARGTFVDVLGPGQRPAPAGSFDTTSRFNCTDRHARMSAVRAAVIVISKCALTLVLKHEWSGAPSHGVETCPECGGVMATGEYDESEPDLRHRPSCAWGAVVLACRQFQEPDDIAAAALPAGPVDQNGRTVREWSLCTEHGVQAVDGQCLQCRGDRSLMQVMTVVDAEKTVARERAQARQEALREATHEVADAIAAVMQAPADGPVAETARNSARSILEHTGRLINLLAQKAQA